MIDLHPVVAFFRKAKSTNDAISHDINRVLGENTIRYLTLGKCVRMLVLSTKKQILASSPNQNVISVLMTTSPLCSQRSHFIQSPNCEENDDIEINSALLFAADHEMEIAAS
jgi:hypothetical protein